MRIPSMVLGATGFALFLAACLTFVSDPSQLTWRLIGLIGASALGGLAAVRLPGLHPLPSSLPLVGAMAVAGGAPGAVLAGFAAGITTALSPPPETETRDRSLASRLAAGWAAGGAIALAAGLVASGYSRMALSALLPATPSAAAPEETIEAVLALLTLLFLLWIVAARLRRGNRRVTAAERRARTAAELVETIALAIEAKDRTSERHLRRMRIYAVEIGRRLGLPAAEIEALEYAALLHDIGKLVVPESILSKPAGLSSEEYQVMSTHARVGAEILETTALPPGVVAMVRHHHERYDGSGYPDGLVGMEIPLGARILAAVDTFDALISERPHRPGMPIAQVVSYLKRQAGCLFDPRVVQVLIENHAAFEALLIAEEKATAARPDAPRPAARNAATRRAEPPFQAVLDRIASSHMEIYSLQEIAGALGKSMNLDESFSLIAAKLQRLVHFSTCAIYILDPEKEILQPRFVIGTGASRIFTVSIPLGHRVSGWAALQRRAAVGDHAGKGDLRSLGHSDLEDLADDPEVATLRSSAAAPLLVDDELVGVIALYDAVDRRYTSREEQLLALIARQVAVAVRTGLLFERTQEHALTDSLTGLPNSRYMFIAFDREAARAREAGTPLTLMVLDIDRFREINDDFGHHAGDRFLVGMAKAIRSQMRICDTCIRYSGDEFIAILPGLAGAEVEDVVERMTDAAKDYFMEARPGRPVRLGLSIGFATLPADGEDFETLISVAEARLQEQKTRHRRREADDSDLARQEPRARPGRH